MKRNEFIAKYVIVHKELPSDDILIEMEANSIFDTDFVKQEEHSIDSNSGKNKPTQIIKDKSYVVCINELNLPDNRIFFPVGAVCYLDDIYFECGSTFRTGCSFKLRIRKRYKGKTGYHYKRIRMSSQEEFLRYFKVIKGKCDISTFDCEKEYWFTRDDGVEKTKCTYTADNSTLIDIDQRTTIKTNNHETNRTLCTQ